MLKKIKVFFLFLFLTPCIVHANENEGSNFIMHHIMDAHEWHLMTINDQNITIPLPIIIVSKDRGIECFMSTNLYKNVNKITGYNGYYLEDETIKSLDTSRVFYDLSITKNVLGIFLSVVILFTILLKVGKWYKKAHYTDVATGMNNVIEMLVLYIRDDVAIPNIGKEKYRKFMPYLLSVFFFIWLNNMLGLLPGSANVTGCITVTMCLALFTFALTCINGTKHYWSHIFLPPVPKPLMPLMALIEFVGMFTKPFTLMIRLFANMTSGHLILLSIVNMIFVFHNGYACAGSVALGAFMILLKMVVAFLQAYVFTLLSSIYLGAAAASH